MAEIRPTNLLHFSPSFSKPSTTPRPDQAFPSVHLQTHDPVCTAQAPGCSPNFSQVSPGVRLMPLGLLPTDNPPSPSLWGQAMGGQWRGQPEEQGCRPALAAGWCWTRTCSTGAGDNGCSTAKEDGIKPAKSKRDPPSPPVVPQRGQSPLLQVPSTASTTASSLRLWCPLHYRRCGRSLGLNSSL